MVSLMNLCRRRGFLFPSADIYGGLRGNFDYGPLGVELKRNLINEWWRSTVLAHGNVVGLDTPILTPRRVLKASGHVDNFSDEVVNCALTNKRFRPEKAPSVCVVEEKVKIQGADRRKLAVLVITAPNKDHATKWANEISDRIAPGALVEVNGSHVRLYPKEITDPRSPADGEESAEKATKGSIVLRGAVEDSPDIIVPYNGFVAPESNSPFITDGVDRMDLMFKVFMDGVDPVDKVMNSTLKAREEFTNTETPTAAKTVPSTDGPSPERPDNTEVTTTANVPSVDARAQIRTAVTDAIKRSIAYLRPETAQGIFVNYLHCQEIMNLRPPFGVAQVGKAFRSELQPEHAVFRTPEFEQMELEYFVHPNHAEKNYDRWSRERYAWWSRYIWNHPRTLLRLRPHRRDELAHYARACVDVEFRYPWGWGEVEGVANRGNYDLKKHSEASKKPLQYLSTEEPADPADLGHSATDFNNPGISPQKNLVQKERAAAAAAGTAVEQSATAVATQFPIVPYVIESSAGVGRTFLAVLVDGYHQPNPKNPNSPIVLRLHPRLAPMKAAVLPVVTSNPDIVRVTRKLAARFRAAGIPVQMDLGSRRIGKKYYAQDEIGTPWCFTVDSKTVETGIVTVRDRDTHQQTRVHMDQAVSFVREKLDALMFHGEEVEE